MERTCGEPDEIKRNTHPRYITAHSCHQANGEEVADKGLYAKVDMEVNSLFFNDAATALVRNRQATENAWRLNNRTDNPHFKATEDWWSRYTVGCRLPGGAYVMTMSQTALWPFANHGCDMASVETAVIFVSGGYSS